MILKVENASGGSTLWDNLTNVTIDKCQMIIEPDPDPNAPAVETFSRINTKSGKGEVMGSPQHVINEHHKLCEDCVVHDGWVVNADCGSEWFSIFFDTKGYLLNNDGRTIEVLR